MIGKYAATLPYDSPRSCFHSTFAIQTMMTPKEKMLAGELYDASDSQLVEERNRARALCRTYNNSTEQEPDLRRRTLNQLLGACPERIFIEPNLRCDYGYNTFIEDNFYANFDLIILDALPVIIGINCMIGPRVSIFTAAHPIDAALRITGLEYGRPVAIGDNVWIGGGAIINPGVTIGSNVIVASGAVVVKDVPDNVLVAGVPAKIVKHV